MKILIATTLCLFNLPAVGAIVSFDIEIFDNFGAISQTFSYSAEVPSQVTPITSGPLPSGITQISWLYPVSALSATTSLGSTTFTPAQLIGSRFEVFHTDDVDSGVTANIIDLPTPLLEGLPGSENWQILGGSSTSAFLDDSPLPSPEGNARDLSFLEPTDIPGSQTDALFSFVGPSVPPELILFFPNNVSVIPEPSTTSFLSLLASLAMLRRKRQGN